MKGLNCIFARNLFYKSMFSRYRTDKSGQSQESDRRKIRTDKRSFLNLLVKRGRKSTFTIRSRNFSSPLQPLSGCRPFSLRGFLFDLRQFRGAYSAFYDLPHTRELGTDKCPFKGEKLLFLSPFSFSLSLFSLTYFLCFFLF